MKSTRPVSFTQIWSSLLICLLVVLASIWLLQQGSLTSPQDNTSENSDSTNTATEKQKASPEPAPQASPQEAELLEKALKALKESEIQLPQQLRRQGEIQSEDVNIRALPSLKSEIIAEPAKGQKFVFTGREIKADDFEWVELELPQRTGWVARQFVIWEDPSLAAESDATENTVQSTVSSSPPQKSTGPLHQQDLSHWHKANEEQQLATAYLMLQGIFKHEPQRMSPENLTALLTCMKASAREPDLQKLKVFELAAACALALEWR